MADEMQTTGLLEFTSKPKGQESTEAIGLTISIDGQRMTVHRPKSVVFAMLANARGMQQKLGMLFDLLRAALTEADWASLQDRINDPDDLLDLDVLAEVAAALAEKWADETKATAPKRARARR